MSKSLKIKISVSLISNSGKLSNISFIILEFLFSFINIKGIAGIIIVRNKGFLKYKARKEDIKATAIKNIIFGALLFFLVKSSILFIPFSILFFTLS